ncbi:hypothetical protein BN1110_01919 [bacterium YEK0313]|nr:hypothetical protein BN1110_01919 [bacterium YEK0313]
MVDVEEAYGAFHEAAKHLRKSTVVVDLTGWARLDLLTLVNLCRQEVDEVGGSLSLSMGDRAVQQFLLPEEAGHISTLLDGVPCTVSGGPPELVLAYQP